MGKNKQVIAVDFDGVIHQYSNGWQDGKIYDDPVEGAIKNMVKLSERYTLYILTTRTNVEEMRLWLIYHAEESNIAGSIELFTKIEIGNIKHKAIAYIDDRGIRFTNWNDMRKYFL